MKKLILLLAAFVLSAFIFAFWRIFTTCSGETPIWILTHSNISSIVNISFLAFISVLSNLLNKNIRKQT